MKPWPLLRLLVLLAAFAISAWFGIVEGYNTWRGSANAGQYIEAAAQMLWGAASLPAIAALFLRAPWGRPVVFVFGMALVLSTALAAVFWGGTGWAIGVASGLVAFLIAGLIMWGVGAHVRTRPGA